MAFATNVQDSGPIGDLNTTPLIDVLLVLLVMFIITIPVATNSIDINLPGPPVLKGPTPDTVKNKVTIDSRDQLLWNGNSINEAQMSALLAETRAMLIEPELQFEPSAYASYAAAARTLKIIKASGVNKFGFVGNDKYRELNGTN